MIEAGSISKREKLVERFEAIIKINFPQLKRNERPQSESLHRGPIWKNKKKPALDTRRGENINRK